MRSGNCLVCRGGDSEYGVIVAEDEVDELLNLCNLSTGVPLDSFGQRNNRCVSAFGIFDLPGQYQEWVKDSNGVGKIRGGSWKQPSGISGGLPAKCDSRITPVLLHSPFAIYERDTVMELFGQKVIWNDSLQKLFEKDTTVKRVGLEEFVDSLYVLRVGASEFDTVLVEDLPASKTQWSDVYHNLDVVEIKKIAGLKIPGESKKYDRFYRSTTLSYRCCARVK
ncbi:hypothetical protein OAA91_01050 [Fibrobacterales bacterium]|nr:hypothetical protein [Fibrobacterales bacterium]